MPAEVSEPDAVARNSRSAAERAAARTFQSPATLPLSAEGGSDPSRDGLRRLRGAFFVAIDRIRPDPDQPRKEFTEAELANLAASIRERGIRQPIRVWYVENENVYQIVSGERRFRAAKQAELSEIPCIVEEVPSAGTLVPKQILVDQVVENWQRQDLNPYDLSDALKALRDTHGLSQDEIARLTGKPKSEISRFLAMQRVVPEVQQQIREDASGQFSRRHVVAVSQLPPEVQGEMVEKIRTENLSAVQTERHVAREKRRTTGKPVRSARSTVRRYAVGSATVLITFRKQSASSQEILDVLDRVRGIVQREDVSDQAGQSAGDRD